jgi:hypothetical protein
MPRLREGEITDTKLERNKPVRYNPESATAHLIQCGKEGVWCDILIQEAIDTVSKKNNEMIEADVKVYDNEGKQPVIKHYFPSDYPGMFKKLCAALGLDYDSGNVPAEKIKGASLQALIKIQEDKTGQFGDKNVCAAFRAKPQAPTGPTPDDPHVFDPNDSAMKDSSEIPF